MLEQTLADNFRQSEQHIADFMPTAHTNNTSITFIRGSFAATNLPTENGFQHKLKKKALRNSAYYSIVRCIQVLLRLRMPDAM